MNQKVFDTQWKVKELMEEAIAVWQQSNFSSQLLPLKDDPVFKLIMSAVAHQTNEIDNDIERFRSDVLDEFSEIFSSYDEAHATPASAVVQVAPTHGTGVLKMDCNNAFRLEGTDFNFLPVLQTRVIPAEINSIVRIDGRRWEVSLSFDSPVSDLSLMSFSLNNPAFNDVRIWIGDKDLPLIRPWEYSELPFSDIFSFENMAETGSPIFDPSMSLVDLFARHGIRMYFIRKHNCEDFIPEETMDLKLTFEFEGTDTNFVFNRNNLILNTILLANVDIKEVTVDSSHPMARITGNSQNPTAQLMHVLNPGKDQIFSNVGVSIRKVAADRFNQASLIRLTASLLDKFHTDYYAFSNIDGNAAEDIIKELKAQLHKLMDLANGSMQNNIGGTYIILDRKDYSDKAVSVMFRYVTTDGAATSKVLTEKSRFISPGGLNPDSTVQIVPPVFGSDEVKTDDDKMRLEQIRRFQHVGNRIVTVNDIRVFCQKELAARYGIVPNLIHDISVTPHRCDDHASFGNACGYEILVSIEIADSSFIRRNFYDRIPQAATLLEKMIQVRSVNIYPISVQIKVR